MQNKFNIFSPWTVNLLHWGLIVLLLLVLPTTLWPLTQRFWISLCLWIFFFSISSLLVGWRETPLPLTDVPFTFNQVVYNIFLCVSIVITPLYLYEMYKLTLDFGLDNMMYSARMVALDQDTKIGIVRYSILINQALFVTTVFAGKQISWWKHVLVTILYASCGLAIMEKGVFIFMGIIAVMVYYMRGMIRVRHIIVVGLLFIMSSFIFTIARSDDFESINDKSSFSEFFEVYLLASPVAYSYMSEETSNQWGVNTFSQFYMLANKLHAGQYEERKKLQEFIDVPLMTNTYTVFQPFYLDFGQWGVAIFAIIYGILLGLSYRSFRGGNSYAALLYAYLLVMLCTQFHQEEIFTSFIRTMQYCFFAFLLIIPSSQIKEKHHETNN